MEKQCCPEGVRAPGTGVGAGTGSHPAPVQVPEHSPAQGTQEMLTGIPTPDDSMIRWELDGRLITLKH